MSDTTPVSESEELLHIYFTLSKLKYLSKEDYSLFPEAFLLKVLDERLAGLHEFAGDICSDLFKQVGCGAVAGVTPQDKQQDDYVAIDVENKLKRYPEFDEYFHRCLSELYDLVLDLRWHNELPSKALPGSKKPGFDLEQIDQFGAFRKSLGEFLRKGKVESKGRVSPTARRRVKFDNLPLATAQSTKSSDESANSSPGAKPSRPISPVNNQDLLDNHSVYALDLLLFGVDIFVQRMTSALTAWSSAEHADLDQQIDMLFDSKLRIRSRQLQVIAKRIKIYNDVQLTVLDHLSEIKTAYLIKMARGTLLARDSLPLLENYKEPRICYYLKLLGNNVEVTILQRLISRCLQIMFNLIICEINVPPVELRGKGGTFRKNRSSLENLVDVQQNVMNFIDNWLKVDEILFGTPQPKERKTAAPKATNLLKQIKRPQLVAKSSTLSMSDKYKSSSRILAQMDNLGEFTSEFLTTIADRLHHSHQHLRYFFDSISHGMSRFFDVIACKLEQQLAACSLNQRHSDTKGTARVPMEQEATHIPGAANLRQPRQHSTLEASIDLMSAKIRCLKFVHIMSTADKIVVGEAARMRVPAELEPNSRLETKLAKFVQTCIMGNNGRQSPSLKEANINLR